MRIPAGDLMPSRAHRRRRRLPRPRTLGRLLIVLVVLAGIGLGVWQWRYRDSSDQTTAGRPCPTPTVAAPVLPAPGAITVRLFNGTTRNGLGATVAAELVARGFLVGTPANAPAPNPGRSRVGYTAADLPAATVLAAQVLDADLVVDPAAVAGSVDLVLGDGYTRLRTPQEATAVLAALPAPSASPTAPAAC